MMTPAAALRGLLDPFSVEITPRETAKLPPLSELLVAGHGRVPDVPAEHAVGGDRRRRPVGRPRRACARCRTSRPGVPDRATLRAMLADLAAIGVDRSAAHRGLAGHPVGEFHETAQILDSGYLEEAGIRRVGVAGHPEGHPDVDDDVLDGALAPKCRIARDRGLDLHLVTQFTFAAEPIVAWERRIRAVGIDAARARRAARAHLPGQPAEVRTVLRRGAVAEGAAQAGRRACSSSRPRRPTSPDETLLALADAVAAEPASLLRAIHFFPFGALVATAEWASGLRDGRFACAGKSRRASPPDPSRSQPARARGASDVLSRRPADRPVRVAQAPRRHRRRDGHRAAPARGLRRARRQDQALGDRRAGRPTACEVRRGLRRDPDAARRGQDHDDGRARPGACRTSGSGPRSRSASPRWARRSGSRAARRAAATARSCRWRCSTCTSPATSTRSPRRTTCSRRSWTTTSTRATRPGIDPHDITWRRVLDVNDRALRNIDRRAGRQAGRRPAADRVRHHRGQRGDGDLRPGHVAARRCGSGSAGSSSATPATASR